LLNRMPTELAPASRAFITKAPSTTRSPPASMAEAMSPRSGRGTPAHCNGMPPHYRRPGWFTTNVFNRAVAGLTRAGISVAGSRVLEVPGRRTGAARRTPVNPLELDGERYLVAPRGDTQWARNLRASGSGRLLVGRRGEEFTATELPDDDKPPILRAYLRRWKWEIGMFFEGVGPDSTDEEMRGIAPRHPVFRIQRS
jgi:deazaflavin-dependent oxidoreductase (nitroreductase family)